MTWALPAALALAAAVVLPLVAHLWSRRTPRTLPFPTLRFLRAASPVSRRLRALQDWPLLCLRAAIVLAIAAAAAGPTLATRGRHTRWQSRLHRVIVVQDEVAGRLDADLQRLQRQASSSEIVRSGAWATRLDTGRRLASRAALRQRTEFVVLWDGTQSRLPRRALSQLSGEVGVSLHSAPVPPVPPPSFARPAALPLDLVDADRQHTVGAALKAGLDLAPGALTDHRVVAVWPGAAAPGDTSPTAVLDQESRAALAQLAGDVRIREAASRSRRDARATAMRFPASAQVVARGEDGAPLLRAWTDGSRLSIGLEAEPGSPLALWAAVAALDAVAAPERWSAASVEDLWTPREIAAASRDASLPGGSRLPGGLDTRAAWAIALALLIAEQWWRSRLDTQRRDGAPADDARGVDDAA